MDRQPTGSGSAPWRPVGRAARIIGVTPRTLHRIRQAGEIDAIRLPSGHFRFNVAGYLLRAPGASAQSPHNSAEA